MTEISTSDKAVHASFQVKLQVASYSSTTLVHTPLFSIVWSQSQTFINIEADHMRTCSVAKLVKYLFDLAPWLSISQSRFMCGKCIKKSVSPFCWSKSQPTWCMIVFITFVMIIEPIWRPMRRLIACFVDDRAVICKAAMAVFRNGLQNNSNDFVVHYATRWLGANTIEQKIPDEFPNLDCSSV